MSIRRNTSSVCCSVEAMRRPFASLLEQKCWALLDEAYASLKTAKSAITRGDYQSFHAPWSNFLRSTGSILNTLDKATRANPQKRQWYGETKQAAKKDQFLSYMHQARNSDEHDAKWTSNSPLKSFNFNGGDRPITSADPGRPANALFTFGKDGLVIDPIVFSANPTINYSHHRATLLPVQDREGKVYNPPTDFFGKPVSPADPITIGELYAVYLEELVNEAAS